MYSLYEIWSFSQKNSLSFWWRLVFRSQDMDAKCASCYCGGYVASLFQWTELGIIIHTYTHIHLHLHVLIYLYLLQIVSSHQYLQLHNFLLLYICNLLLWQNLGPSPSIYLLTYLISLSYVTNLSSRLLTPLGVWHLCWVTSSIDALLSCISFLAPQETTPSQGCHSHSSWSLKPCDESPPFIW